MDALGAVEELGVLRWLECAEQGIARSFRRCGRQGRHWNPPTARELEVQSDGRRGHTSTQARCRKNDGAWRRLVAHETVLGPSICTESYGKSWINICQIRRCASIQQGVLYTARLVGMSRPTGCGVVKRWNRYGPEAKSLLHRERRLGSARKGSPCCMRRSRDRLAAGIHHQCPGCATPYGVSASMPNGTIGRRNGSWSPSRRPC